MKDKNYNDQPLKRQLARLVQQDFIHKLKGNNPETTNLSDGGSRTNAIRYE